MVAEGVVVGGCGDPLAEGNKCEMLGGKLEEPRILEASSDIAIVLMDDDWWSTGE